MILGYRVYTKYLDIKSSSTCQLKCKHCAMRKSMDGSRTNWEKVRKLLHENPSVEEIHLGGGEPFVTEDNAKDIYELITEFPNIKYKVTTNLCYPLTEYRRKALENIDSLQTSFDIGIRFENIHNLLLWMRNVRELVKVRDIDVFCCLTNKLKPERIPKLIHMFYKMGFYGYKIIPICNVGSAKDNYLIPSKQHVKDILTAMIEYDISEGNETIDLFHDGMFTICPYGTECTPINSNVEIKNCGIKERENCHCSNDPECYICPNFQYCGGRCVLIPCYYDKDLYDRIKSCRDRSGEN